MEKLHFSRSKIPGFVSRLLNIFIKAFQVNHKSRYFSLQIFRKEPFFHGHDNYDQVCILDLMKPIRMLLF